MHVWAPFRAIEKPRGLVYLLVTGPMSHLIIREKWITKAMPGMRQANSLNSVNGILPGERVCLLSGTVHLNCLDLPQHINCKVINEV